MLRMIFRHITGARATDVDVVDLGEHRELILGRASSAAVRFDPRRDGSVGRHHARIAWSLRGATRFMLTDLESRNGTFVNGRRVAGTVVLQLGDVLELGAGGPKIEIGWEVVPSLVSIDVEERIDEETHA
jgi:pSer/pThr/pTyr-binding forkhead associated (FHA) protein